MIFGDINQPAPDPVPDDSHRRHRRRRSTQENGDPSTRRRRSSMGGASLRQATKIEQPPRDRHEGSTTAWLWVLVLLIAGTIGFAFYLHQERSAPRRLGTEAPSAALMPFIDPVLAPLETGISGYTPEALSDLQSRFRAEGEKVNIDDRDIFSTAAAIAQILQEAQQDRARHLERLLKLGAPVEGMTADPDARNDISDTERKHLELAVDISWQRNSGTYRNRVEELWYRLLRREQGRFANGSASQAMTPDVKPLQ